MPSPEDPLTGGCACGTIRFEITAPFQTAGYCHCKRCQQRSGALWSLNAVVDGERFALVSGAESLQTWYPDGGKPKSFCGECGGHLFSGVPGDSSIGVRLGAVDGDPGIRPTWRQWLESAPAWEPIPDDGTERFAQSRFK